MCEELVDSLNLLLVRTFPHHQPERTLENKSLTYIIIFNVTTFEFITIM